MAVDRYFYSESNKNEEFRLLSKEEEQALFEKFKNDRAAIEYELTKHNIFFSSKYSISLFIRLYRL